MTADHTRAMRRLHAVAKSYGIDHELISAWADDVHRAESTRDVPAHAIVAGNPARVVGDTRDRDPVR